MALIFEKNKPVASSIIGGGGAHFYIFVFCTITFFWNRLFLWSANTNIWICAPLPIVELVTGLQKSSVVTCTDVIYLSGNYVTSNTVFKLCRSPSCLERCIFVWVTWWQIVLFWVMTSWYSTKKPKNSFTKVYIVGIHGTLSSIVGHGDMSRWFDMSPSYIFAGKKRRNKPQQLRSCLTAISIL